MNILHQSDHAVGGLVENLLHTRCHLVGAVLQFLMNVEVGAVMLFQFGFLADERDEIGAHVDDLKQKVNRLGDAAERGIHGNTADFCDDVLGVLKVEVLIHIQNPPISSVRFLLSGWS